MMYLVGQLTSKSARMKSQDLTLLYVFDAIMTEVSVSRAAHRLGMTQPAVSNAIARMRDLWQDPLFVKKGRQIEPTAYALNLWQQVRAAMQQLSAAIDTNEFNPSTSQRQFRIALTDLAVDQYWVALTRAIAKQAPLVDLYAVPFTQLGAVDQLRAASVDLALGPRGHADRSLRASLVFTGAFKLAMRKQHPLACKSVSLKKFLAARHLLVSRSGDAQGHVDRELQKEGKQRRIAVTVNHASVVPKMLLQTDLIAVVPEQVVNDPQLRAKLWVTDSPVVIEPTPIYLMWHARLDHDPGLIWLRKLLEEIVREQQGG